MNGIHSFRYSPDRRRREHGYTLVELLVSITILSIALLGIMSAIDVARDTQNRSVHLAVARDIVVSEIEQMRAVPEATVAMPMPPYSSPDLPRGNTVTRTATRYPDGSSLHMWRAVVTVTWPEGAGNRDITYDTLLYKP